MTTYPEHYPIRDYDAVIGSLLAGGAYSGYEVIQKFGRNESVGTTFEPISQGGLYPTPQVAGATTLRIKAGGDANDTAAGSGAREITLVGLDETGAVVTETLATAGASASSATSASFIRLYRMWVTASGTYATASSGSHTAAITIENGAGGTDWGIIDATGIAKGQSEIGVYTVPLGVTAAYVLGGHVSVDSSKTVDLVFFQRQNILETAAPYTAMRTVEQWTGLNAYESWEPRTPKGPFPALTDLGFMGKVASTAAAVDVAFDVLLLT